MKQAILNHYGFSRLPFSKDISPTEVFPTASGREAASMLELGLETEDIMVLIGSIGCGKSLVLRSATLRFDSNQYQVIYLRGSIGKPAELEETIGYIEHGLKIVKYSGSLFSDNAKMEIFRRTGGIARAINSLCYRAILGGAIEQKQVIDTADIPQAAG
jgi:type II secretory pathway predicted ATPase ExeA